MDCTPCSTCPPTKTYASKLGNPIEMEDLMEVYDVHYGKIIITPKWAIVQPCLITLKGTKYYSSLGYGRQVQATN